MQLGEPLGKRSCSKKEQEGKQLGLPTEPSQLEEGGMKEAGWARRCVCDTLVGGVQCLPLSRCRRLSDSVSRCCARKLGREDVSRAREDVSQFAAAVASVGSTGDSSDDDESARAGSLGGRLEQILYRIEDFT